MVNFAKYSAILSIIPAFFVSFFPGKIIIITILCYLPLLYLIFKYLHGLFFSLMFEGKFSFVLFYLYGIITLIRGAWLINSNDDFKAYVYSSLTTYLLIPLMFFIGINLKLFGFYTRYFIFYGLILCFVMYLLPVNSGMYGYGHIITPIYLLALFFPFISFKIRFFLALIILLSVFNDLTNRSSMVNGLFSVLLILTYYLRNFKTLVYFYKTLSSLLLLLPFLFIFLGTTGQFNIFQIGEYTEDFVVTDSNRGSQNLLVDSRTSIYKDVFEGLSVNDAVVFGLGSGGKVITSLAEEDEYYDIYKEGRVDSESGMLNYIQWGGIIACLSIFLLYWKAVYLSIYKSNNFLSKMIGMYIAFKFFFSFVEDQIIFNSNSVIIFTALGLCFNEHLRSLSDDKIDRYVKWVMNYNYPV